MEAMMDCPIIESKPKGIRLEPGTYSGSVLKIEHTEFDSKETPGEKEQKIAFTFLLDDGTGEMSEVRKYVNPTNNELSGLVKLLRGLAPKTFTEAIRKDRFKTWEFCKSLVGLDVLVAISVNEHGRKVVSNVIPAPGSKPKPAPQPKEDAASDDDDIPF